MIRYLLEPLQWFVTRRYLYHLDKMAHTALLAIALAALRGAIGKPAALTVCAIWAAAMYVVVGKVIWLTSASYRRHRTGPWRPSLDTLSDTALSWAVVMLAATYEGHWRLALVSLLLFPTVYIFAVATRRTSP